MPRQARQYPRVRPKNLVANLEGGPERLTGCIVDNISLGGMFVRTGGRFPDGVTLSAELVSPGLRKSLRLSACVVGLEQYPRGIRLKFLESDPEATDRLAELLESFGLRRRTVPSSVTPPPPPQPALEGDDHRPTPPPPPADAQLEPPAPGGEPIAERLMLQIKGLILELSEAHRRIAEQDSQIQSLKIQLEQFRKLPR